MRIEEERVPRGVIQSRSEFMKVVSDFTDYVKKEYTDGCNSRRSIIVCASEDLDGEGHIASVNAALGGRRILEFALTSMMRQPETKDLFRRASASVVDPESAQQEYDSVRSHLRQGYAITAMMALWAAVVIFIWAVGVQDAVTTISSLLLTAVSGYLIYKEIRRQRRRLERLKENLQEEKRKKSMQEIDELLERFIYRHMEDDDE